MSGAIAAVWAWAGAQSAASRRGRTASDGVLRRDIGFSTD
jgi:hypothetical protein